VSYARGNLFSLSGYSHCHAVFKTDKRLYFEEFKNEFRNNVSSKVCIVDIERVHNLKCSITYMTKEDARAVVEGFDKGLA
jgi:hypothetical protein